MKQVDGTPGPGDGHEPGLFIMETLIGKTLSHYRIVEKIGAGGMGEVYRAHDSRLGRDVAIKVIPAELSRDPDRIKRFEQEARAAGALNHPNVCAIYDVGTHEGTPYVVMELLEGESLRDRIAAGPIPLRKALDYAAQVAHGLAAAHEKGIVHRDLKPANLFVTKSGRVKVSRICELAAEALEPSRSVLLEAKSVLEAQSAGNPRAWLARLKALVSSHSCTP